MPVIQGGGITYDRGASSRANLNQFTTTAQTVQQLKLHEMEAARVRMNDLFTLPDCRGRGIGKALILHCLDYARSQGAIRLQWATATDNHTAQRLYNSLKTHHKPWLFYTYQGENPA